MKGSAAVARRMSYAEHAKALTEAIKAENIRLEGLPKEEAKREATAQLIRTGILDKNGNVTEPYAHLRGYV